MGRTGWYESKSYTWSPTAATTTGISGDLNYVWTNMNDPLYSSLFPEGEVDIDDCPEIMEQMWADIKRWGINDST